MCNLAPSKPRAPIHVLGFTSMELMVTVAIATILITLAMPSFSMLLDRWRVRDAAESMESTLYYAKSEGIKRAGGVGVQKKPNSASCSLASTSDEWGCGWFVFLDTNGDGKWQTTEEILQTYTAPKNTNVIHYLGGISFKVDRFGLMSGMNAKGFVFSPDPVGISSPATRSLCMSTGGRIRIIDTAPCV